MGAGKLRVLAGRGAVAAGMAAGVAVLAAGCASPASSGPAAGGQAAAHEAAVNGSARAPSTVPVLGRLTIGKFPATFDGGQALMLCQQWAGLRGQYAASAATESPYRLEQWFSGTDWQQAFKANSPLQTDPAYTAISTAFGLVSTGSAASIDNARLLDAACAAAD